MKLPIAIVLGIASQLLGGFVLSSLWGWFVWPVFGWPAPDYLHCIGLIFTINFIGIGTVAATVAQLAKDEKPKEPYALPLVMLVVQAFAWVIGLLWHMVIR